MMRKRKINYLAIFFNFLALINFSCKEKCPKEVELGDFYLSEKSKNMFPYQSGEEKLIFKDSLNNILTFQVKSSNEVYLSQSNWSERCILNDSVTKEIDVKAKKEWQNVLLEPDSLINSSFNIFLKQEVDIDASDLDEIKEIDGINIYRSNVGQMAIITDVKNAILDELPSEKVEHIKINGKNFYNVLRSRKMNSGDIYYDNEKGIIAIDEHLGNFEKAKYWVLDSIVYKN